MVLVLQRGERGKNEAKVAIWQSIRVFDINNGYLVQEFENNSASSQIFWLLKESELTPSNANILDGRYAVFGYVTENEDFLADLKVGDVIESMQVVFGLDNLVNPTYKISG